MSVTINQKQYQSVIDTFHGLLQLRQNLQFESQCIQPDGATHHTATATMRHFNELFGRNIISKKSALSWLPRSLDLSPLDFFLWRYCKDRVYHNNSQNVTELQRFVKDFIANIPKGMCKRVNENPKMPGGRVNQEFILNTAYNCMELSESL